MSAADEEDLEQTDVRRDLFGEGAADPDAPPPSVEREEPSDLEDVRRFDLDATTADAAAASDSASVHAAGACLSPCARTHVLANVRERFRLPLADSC